MAYEYQKHIAKCKAPKNPSTIKVIVSTILDGIRKGLNTFELAEYLNDRGVKTIMNKPWNYYNLQMQLLKMARLDSDSSLAWGLNLLLEEGTANESDLFLLTQRTKKSANKSATDEETFFWNDDQLSDTMDVLPSFILSGNFVKPLSHVASQ